MTGAPVPVTPLGRCVLEWVARDFQSLRSLREEVAGTSEDGVSEADIVAELMELEEGGLVEAYGSDDSTNAFVRVPVHMESEFESLWFGISKQGRVLLRG